MKISLDWLRNYVPISTPPEALAHRLTMAGLEVEKIENVDGDAVFEMEITPNRPDCLSHLGIAREISAILNKTLKPPKIKKLKIPTKKADITIEDKNDCRRYIGVVVQNISAKESPSKIAQMIFRLGLRSVNNIVDITNFCLLETGQPMHAFDYDKLIGGKIIVRRARQGETIVTIDGEERKLDTSILIIADAKRPVAIAGIMGGKETEVTESTKNILLESAYFDPILIRRASRVLGLSSDSSYRFERGVDMETVKTGAHRALSLIQEYAGGQIQSCADVFPRKSKTSKSALTLSLKQVNTFLGVKLPPQRIKSILVKLGFKISSSKKDSLKIMPPSFREDIKQVVDVLEEIARIIGYDRLPVSLPLVKATGIPPDRNRALRKIIRESLCAQGLNEAITYAMINPESLLKAKQKPKDVVKVKNPLSKDQEIMRPTLLPGFLSLAQTNINKGQKDLAFFETGKIYGPAGEQDVIAILMAGQRSQSWRDKERTDFFDIKGVIQETAKRLGCEDLEFANNPHDIFEEGQGTHILLDGKKIGELGPINQEILSQWDIKQKGIYYAEMRARTLYEKACRDKRYAPIPQFPSIARDISLAVQKDISFNQIKEIISRRGSEFLTSIRFVEQYLGEKISDRQRGMTISLLYQSSERTLQEDEVNRNYQDICQALKNELGAIQR
ncbi:MAG: phenylalanine--tRNA ligase subunit beta [Candidatus Omnitrophota bacterium]